MNHKQRKLGDKAYEDKWNHPEGYFRGFQPYKKPKEFCRLVSAPQYYELKPLVENSKFEHLNEAIKCWGADHSGFLTDKQVGYLTKWLVLDKNVK